MITTVRAAMTGTSRPARRRLAVVAALFLSLSVVAAPSLAAAPEYVEPAKVASGYSPSLAVDGAGKSHIAFTKDNRGLGYVTNKSGSWVTKSITAAPAVATVRDMNASLAVDGNGKVHIAFVRYDFAMPQHSLGLFYATNKSGSWVVKRLTTGDDRGPSIAVGSTGVHIAYWRYSADKWTVKHAVKGSGAWAFQNVSSAGFPHSPSLTLLNGSPAIAFIRSQGSTVPTPCGVYLWRPGASLTWASRAVDGNTDEVYNPFAGSCDFARPTVGKTVDGAHIVFSHGGNGTVGQLWQSFKGAEPDGSWGVQAITGETSTNSPPAVVMSGGRIDVVFSRALQGGSQNGLWFISSVKQPGGEWAPEVGGPAQVTSASSQCPSTSTCDYTPSLALAAGTSYLAFFRGGQGVLHTHD